MELIRQLLIMIESQSNINQELSIPNNMNRQVVVYHLNLMEQAGLTKNSIKYAEDQPLWIYSNLIWEGHDFLDSIKNSDVWEKTKQAIKLKGLELGEVSFSILKELAKVKIKQLLGI